MYGIDYLPSIAEIAATLIGFSGLAAAFRTGLSGWDRRRIAGVSVILAFGFAALVGSLIPVALSATEMSPAAVWGTSSAVLGLLIAAAVCGYVIITVRLTHAGQPSRWPRVNLVLFSSAGAVSVMLLLGAVGWWVPGGAAVHLFGLIACIGYCVIYLALFILQSENS